MRRSVVHSLVFLAALALAGCEKKAGIVVAPDPFDGGPRPDSPANALRLLEWGYQHKDLDSYGRLFTADYRFVFSDLDSNGAAYRDYPWTRTDELFSTWHLFSGGDANQPPASDIQLTFDRNFNVTLDPRPGQNPTWHKAIETQLVLNVRLSDGHADDITGSAKFYLVRGDSALLPEGLGPDSTLWYVERWEDLTAQGAGRTASRPNASAHRSDPGHPDAARPLTWGGLKSMYR